MEKIKIVGSLFITVLTRIESIWALIILITNNKGGNNMTIQIDTWQYWSFQIIVAIGIFTFSYIILKKIDDLRKKLEIQNLIAKVRNWFMLCPDDQTIYSEMLENETLEQYNERIITPKHHEYLKKEYKEVQNKALRELDISNSEIVKIMDDIYKTQARS